MVKFRIFKNRFYHSIGETSEKVPDRGTEISRNFEILYDLFNNPNISYFKISDRAYDAMKSVNRIILNFGINHI